MKGSDMKISILLSLALPAVGIIGSGCSPEAPAEQPEAKRYIIGLSPFLADENKDEVFRRIVGFILEEVPSGSSAWIYDAFHNKTIARIDVPTARAFASPKTRTNQFQDEIGHLKTFLAESHSRPELGDLDFANTVRLPQFMTFLADNLRSPEIPTTGLLIGSPLYLDPKEASFSMVDGYFPSDGHLKAARELSVYSADGRDGALENVHIHLGWFGDPWSSEVHEAKIRRFWSLYLAEQGGRLASFTGDLATAFGALNSPTGLATEYEIDPAQSRVEMLRISREVGVSDWITRDLSTSAPSPAPRSTVGPMKIGIRWSGDIDLDLYARPSGDGETLFFQHVRSEAGFYFKDHRSSPEREYEFIEFHTPIDALAADAWVNFYEGDSNGPVSGEVRVEFEGRIYAKPFTIAASHGNQGEAGEGQSAHWTRLDIPGALSLR